MSTQRNEALKYLVQMSIQRLKQRNMRTNLFGT